MVEIVYAPKFVRAYKKFVPGLKKEIKAAIELFADRANHERLRVHKLSGRMEGRYGFSVNYQTRIVFQWDPDGRAVFLIVGDHDIYE